MTTQETIIQAARKLAAIITQMRETDYDQNALHGHFIAAHEELNIALKRHDAAQARRNGTPKLLRGTDLLPKPAA